MAKKKKYYVVWHGREKGIFEDWNQCKASTYEYPKAKYKAFENRELAHRAFVEGFEKHWGQRVNGNGKAKQQTLIAGEIIYPSLSVDAAWNTRSLQMEYQGVDTQSGIKLFHKGPLDDGTNNVGEFLAIVHALAYLKKHGSSIPIYSDSRNAISWVKKKKHASSLQLTDKNKEIFDLLQRAEKWLRENKYENKVLKWETKVWGENPADFGRK